MALGDLLGGFGSGAIGGAVVTLELANEKYKAELAQSQAQTTTATKTMGGGLSQFKGVATAAFLAVGVAAVKFGIDSVAAAREAQASQTELANSIKNSATVSTDAIPAFNAQSEAIRKLTGADDEAITSAQAFLVQMKLTEEQVLGLTPLVVDLATKMDVDMQTAAKAVGKSVNGTTGGLARMGVVVDETAAKSDSYKATLDALAVAQGFAAQKAEDEPFRLLASSIEELQEKIGTALVPSLNNMAEQLNEVMEVLPTVVDWTGKFFKLIEFGIPGLKAFNDAINGANSDLPAFESGLAAIRQKLDEGTISTSRAIGWVEKLADEVGVNLPNGAASMVEALKKGTDATGDFGRKTDRARSSVRRFAGMGATALKEWRESTKESFDAVLGTLDAAKIEWEFTARSFGRAMDNMRVRAQTLDRNMRDIAKADWVPEPFKKWLIDQGPGALRGFMEQSRRQKEQSIQDWKASETAVEGAKGSLTKLKSTLGDLNNQKSTATVRVKYEYVGFNPDMPGMAP